jgi:hypothetical protein
MKFVMAKILENGVKFPRFSIVYTSANKAQIEKRGEISSYL